MNNVKKANQILAWFSKTAKKNGTTSCSECGCKSCSVWGVKLSEINSYLRKYYPDLTDWIEGNEEGIEIRGDIHIEDGLFRDIINGVFEVSTEWDMDKNRYVAYNPETYWRN